MRAERVVKETRTIGFSFRQRLLQMRDHVDMQERVMQVTQGRSRLRVLPMFGAVCQRCTPEPTGRAADNAGRKHRGDGYGEAK